MFQFTTETIINSNVDSSSGKTKFYGNLMPNTFSVLHAGNYKKSDIVSVFKSPYSAAITETLVKTLTATFSAAKVYRLNIEIQLSGSANSEWANEFVHRSKIFNYEITGVSTQAAAAAALVAAVAKEATTSGFNHFTLTNVGAALTLIAGTEYQRFKKVEIQELLDGTVVNGAVLTGYNNFTVLEDLLATPTTWTKGKQGFGTSTWLTKNLRLPTIDRTNFTAIAQDELPVPGGQYTQYSIRTAVKRDNTGMGTVGQEMTSITTAVFYVISTAVAAFEAAMLLAGITNIITISTTVGLSIQGDETLLNSVTSQYTVTGNSGVITWSITTALAGASIDSATGVVTTGTADGPLVIQASDAGTGKTASFAITVA